MSILLRKNVNKKFDDRKEDEKEKNDCLKRNSPKPSAANAKKKPESSAGPSSSDVTNLVVIDENVRTYWQIKPKSDKEKESNIFNKNCVCKICKKTLSSPSKLKRHQLVHTGEKPFVCPFCGKPFSLLYNMKVHYLTHFNIKRYVCPQCFHKFTQKINLTSHIRTRHRFTQSQ